MISWSAITSHQSITLAEPQTSKGKLLQQRARNAAEPVPTSRQHPVSIDNQRFERCTFDRCALTFNASGPVQFIGCTFNDCSFEFDGAAAAKVKFMTELYKLVRQMIELTFRQDPSRHIATGKWRKSNRGTRIRAARG